MTIVSALLTAAPTPAAQQQMLTDFDRYPATEKFTGSKTKLVLRSAQDREFRTALGSAAKQRPNFAGRYIVTTFGCGSSCVMGAIIDPVYGQVTWLPFTVCCGNYSQMQPIEFRIGSRLMIIRGMRNEQESGTYYYQFEQGHLKLIAERPD